MINYFDLINEIKKKKFHKNYIFYGTDENLIKESIGSITNIFVNNDFKDFNLSKLDGNKVSFDEIYNTCETLPIMSEKKAVIVYRATFLSDKTDSDNASKYSSLLKYLKNMPEHCIFICYYILNEGEKKPSKKIKSLEGEACVVRIDKLKGISFNKKVQHIFEERGKEISKADLSLFCSMVDNNLNVVQNEIDKLCSFVGDRGITKEDIKLMQPQKSENIVYTLLDYVIMKKPQKAIDILNELIYKGESPFTILRLIQRQFYMLYAIKENIRMGKSKEEIMKQHNLLSFVYDNYVSQLSKYKSEKLKKALQLSLNSEQILKSTNMNKKTELEMLIINIAMI